MQSIHSLTQTAIEAGSQSVVPKVEVEWQNSSAISSVVDMSSSDDYFDKTLELDPWFYMPLDFKYYYMEVLRDTPLFYSPAGSNVNLLSAVYTPALTATPTALTGVQPSVYNGAAETVPTVYFDTGTKYNGSSSFVDIATNPNLNFGTWNKNEFTFEAWVKPTSIGANQPLFAKGSSDAEFLFKIDTTGLLSFTIDLPANSNGVVGRTVLTAGVWQHVAATWDGYKLSVYLNGALDGVRFFPTTGPTRGWSNTSAFIGKMLNPSTFYNGILSDTAIYRSALTQERIQSHYRYGVRYFYDYAGNGASVSSTASIYPKLLNSYQTDYSSPTIDNVTSGAMVVNVTNTIPFTIGGGSNRMVAIGISYNSTAALTATATFNGVAMSKNTTSNANNAGAFVTSDVFYIMESALPAAPGTYNIVITLNATTGMTEGRYTAFSLINAGQSVSQSQSNSNVGFSTLSTSVLDDYTTIPSERDVLIFQNVAANVANDPSPDEALIKIGSGGSTAIAHAAGLLYAHTDFVADRYAVWYFSAAQNRYATNNLAITFAKTPRYLSVFDGYSRVRATTPDIFLRLDGITDHSVDLTDNVGISLTGNIDFRFKIAPDDWTPSSSQKILSKESGVTGYAVMILNTGALRFQFGDGAAQRNVDSTVSVPNVTNGQMAWIRITRANASGITNFYVSDDGTEWRLFSSVTANAGSAPTDNNNGLRIGARTTDGSAEKYIGKVYYVELRNGINGTIVASPTFSGRATGTGITNATCLTDTQGNVWRWFNNGSASNLARIASDQTDTTSNGQFNYTDNFTVEAWSNLFEHPGNGNRYTIVSKGSGPNDAELLNQYSIDYIGASGSRGSGSATTQIQGSVWVGTTRKTVNSGNITVGKWNHTVMTIKSGTMYLYVNGVLAGSIALTDSANITGGSLYIGSAGEPEPNYYNASGAYMSTPNSIALQITGDIDLRALVALSDWTPAAVSGIVGKWNQTSNQRSYFLGVTTTGALRMAWSNDGTTVNTADSTVIPDFVDGKAYWIRATLDVVNGAATGRDIQFFTSYDGVNWSQLGSTVTQAGVTSIFNSSSQGFLMAMSAGAEFVSTGKIYYAEIRNGISGTIVGAPDFRNRLIRVSTITDAYALSWTSSVAATGVASDAKVNTQTFPGLISDVAVYPSVKIWGDQTYARYLSGLKSTAYKGEPFSGDELVNGRDKLNYVWAGPSLKNVNGLTPSLSSQLVPIENQNNDPTFKYEYGWVGSDLSHSTAATFSLPQIAVLTFTDISCDYIKVTTPTQYGGIGKFKVYYLTTSDVWTQVGGTWEFLSTRNEMIIPLNSRTTIRGLQIRVDSTQYVSDRSKICELVPLIKEDVSVDVVSINVKKIKEEFDSSVPFGATAANECEVVLQDVDLKYNVKNTSSTVYGFMKENVPLKVALGWNNAGGPNGLSLNGVSGNYVSSPDSEHLSITGDIDIRVKVAPTDWTPATDNMIVSKYLSTGNQRSYNFGILSSGALRLYWSADGSAVLSADSTVGTGLTDGSTKWIRVTLDVDNGAAGRDIKFYTSDDGTSWTQLGTTVTQGSTTSIFNSTAALNIGGWDNGTTDRFTGTIYNVEIRNGLDGQIVADVDFVTHPINASSTTVVDDINIYTLNGSAALATGGTEYIPQGTFYADTWSTGTTDMTTVVQCRDRSKLIQETNNNDVGYAGFDLTAAKAISNMAKIAGIPDADITFNKTYSEAVLADTPLSFWNFGLGPSNFCLDFNETYATTSPRVCNPPRADIASNAFTVMFWMKSTDNPGATWKNIVNFAISSQVNQFCVQMGTGGAIRYVKNGTNGASQAMAINDGKWHHIAVSFTGTSAPIWYKDGKQFSTDGTVAANTTLNNSIFSVGKGMSTWPSTFANSDNYIGQLDNVAVFSTNLSNPGLYGSIDIKPGIHANLWLTYKFGEGADPGSTSEDIRTDNSVDSYHWLDITSTDTGLYQTEKVGIIKDAASKLDATVVSATSYANSSAIVSEDFKAMQFNGTSDYAILPGTSEFSFSNKVTFEGWIYKVSTATGVRTLLHKSLIGSVTADTMDIGVDVNGKLYIGLAGGGYAQTVTSLPTDQWVHVAITLDRTVSNTPTMYFNGVATSVTGTITSNFNTNVEPWMIGMNGNGGQFWSGYIASMALWDRALTASQISTHYTAGITPIQKKFSSLWTDSDNLWESMLTVALADLGMFYFNENNVLVYESARNFYTSVYPQHNSVQWNLSGSTNIVSGEHTIDLITNKVIVKINPTTSRTATAQQVWSGPDNESLAATTLAAAVTESETTSISYTSRVDSFGVRQPIFHDVGYIRIDDEIIKYESKDDFKFYTLTRGMFNTLPTSHGNGTFVGEARKYEMEWTDSPVVFVKFPFLTADIFDGTVDVHRWFSTPNGGELVISLNNRFQAKDVYQVLQGTNPVSDLQNHFSVAGIPAKAESSTGKVTETSTSYQDQIRRYGIKAIEIDNPFIQERAYAESVAAFVLDHNDNLVPILNLQTIGIPQLQLGDRVRITSFAQMSITNVDYFVMGIEIEYDGGVQMQLILREVD